MKTPHEEAEHKPDGYDVAIAAFIAARLCGGTNEEATRNAKAMLELFGIKPEPSA